MGLTMALSFPAFAQPQENGGRDLVRVHSDLLSALLHGGKKGDGLSLNESDGQSKVHECWSVLQRWTESYLDAHPKSTAGQLAGSFDQLLPKAEKKDPEAKPLDASVIQLKPGTYAVSVAYSLANGGAGNFFVVTRRKGKHQVAWNVLDLARPHFESRDELGRWAYLSDAFYYNGSLTGSVYLLPPTRAGHPRFYVRAFQYAHGGTLLPQVSIWEWDGMKAIPLLIRSFLEPADDDFGQRFAKGLLQFGTKEPSDTFTSYGGTTEPRGIWTIRIGKESIEDLGHRWVEPNARLVDELCEGLRKNQSVSHLASGKVIAWMKDRFKPDPEAKEGEELRFYLGMYSASKTTREKAFEVFRIECDEGIFSFKVNRRNGHRFIVDCWEPPD